MSKHAYLILCHTNFLQLNILLRLLDDRRNDIYIHIDKKSSGYLLNEITKGVEYSNIFFVKPVKVSWGGDSMIKAEIRLLQESSKHNYQYYHLISGLDLPVKSKDYIYDFFENQQGANYVSIDYYPNDSENTYLQRVKYYYFFQNLIGRNKGKMITVMDYVQNKFLLLQEKHGVDRIKKTDLVFVKGGNWFDITHEAVDLVLREYRKYKKVFRWTICADEIFVQTLIYNSHMKKTIYPHSLRLVDWERGRPYIFTSVDYNMLVNSEEEKLFARKFDMKQDMSIINELYYTWQKNEHDIEDHLLEKL